MIHSDLESAHEICCIETMPSEREKMMAGELYLASDPELVDGRARAKRLFREYNRDPQKAILEKLLGTCPEEVVIEADFKCDYGSNIHLGENFYSNFDDVGSIQLIFFAGSGQFDDLRSAIDQAVSRVTIEK